MAESCMVTKERRGELMQATFDHVKQHLDFSRDGVVEFPDQTRENIEQNKE
jgi:hypothetical protein